MRLDELAAAQKESTALRAALTSQKEETEKLRGELGRTDVLYARLVVLAALLDVMDAGAEWKRRLIELMDRYPRVPHGVLDPLARAVRAGAAAARPW